MESSSVTKNKPIVSRALLESVRSLEPTIRACAVESERDRKLPAALVRQLAEAGLFRMYMPGDLDGAELDPISRMEIIEELARADASVAWCVEIGSGIAWIMSGWLHHEAARQILCSDYNAVVGGSITINGGRAMAVEGGYIATGRWAWGSGCTHATWMAGNCAIFDGNVPRLRQDGMPEIRTLVFPRSDLDILDTWNSMGLRGSGSHDFTVNEIFVPVQNSFNMLNNAPTRAGALHAFRAMFLSAAAALALGIAHAAIDALVELAEKKVPSRSSIVLRERGMVQIQVAQAEALVSSARAFVWDVVGDIWRTILAGNQVSFRQRAIFRLAITHAVSSAVKAVDLMYSAAGGSSVCVASLLERQFRDVHTLAQHASLATTNLEPAGRALLGLEPGVPLF